MPERVGQFLAGLSHRKDEVIRRCRTVLQSRAAALQQNSQPNSLVVASNEDQARNRKSHCAENVGLLAKLALNLARLEPSKGSVRGKPKRAGWDNHSLVVLLTQFANLFGR